MMSAMIKATGPLFLSWCSGAMLMGSAFTGGSWGWFLLAQFLLILSAWIQTKDASK